jgi:hypothetical protein
MAIPPFFVLFFSLDFRRALGFFNFQHVSSVGPEGSDAILDRDYAGVWL